MVQEKSPKTILFKLLASYLGWMLELIPCYYRGRPNSVVILQKRCLIPWALIHGPLGPTGLKSSVNVFRSMIPRQNDCGMNISRGKAPAEFGLPGGCSSIPKALHASKFPQFIVTPDPKSPICSHQLEGVQTPHSDALPVNFFWWRPGSSLAFLPKRFAK